MRTSGRTQRAVARDLDKAPPRISELLRSLDQSRPLRDRLTLVTEMADVLGLTPILVPTRQLDKVMAVLGQPTAPMTGTAPASLFDELFIDLTDRDDAEDGQSPPLGRR